MDSIQHREYASKALDDDKDTIVETVVDEKHHSIVSSDSWTPPEAWLERLKSEYTGQHDGETLPPGSDVDRVVEAIFTMNELSAVDMLRFYIDDHQTDYTFDRVLMARLKELVKGYKVCDMEESEWNYQVCKTAGIIHNWSPYAEVRAVTVPYDNMDEPCETLRAYILGLFWVCVLTAVNTFFAPRQPGINIPNSVAQLILVPMGRAFAWILPDWGFTFRGQRYSLNNGPWSQKEQLFATILFSGASSIGNFTGLLVMRLPVFFGQRWVTFGYALILSFANQIYGLGAAGVLRRLTVYPMEAVWPQNLPILALNRTLINRDNKRETVNGWSISRFKVFVIAGVIFLIYYWIPNEFFNALRLFNWMTWISPNNFNLATITGSYGGMGFNPISTWDPNVSGINVMNSPFFAQFQQYIMRVISGIIIIILYYRNVAWAAFMPINSNTAFDNTMHAYNISKVLNPDNSVDIDAYKAYSPPYYPIANLFVTAIQYAYYTFSVVYVFTRYWKPLKKCFVGMVVNTLNRQSIYTGFTDGNTRLVSLYPEVPEWWYGIVFVFGFVVSICACVAWPTQTPWWSIVAMTGIGGILTIPWVIIESIANTGISLGTIWQVLPGVWFPGKYLPQLILLMLGGAFEQVAGGFTADLKYAHYARLPPRAVFRGHLISAFVNCIIYCGILEAMLVYFNDNSTLCNWDNKYAMVCSYAHSIYSSTISFGAFGTNNQFKLYPVLPYAFLIGAILGAVWIIGEWYGPSLHRYIERRMSSNLFFAFNKWFWIPVGLGLSYLNPAIALSGATNWAGNTNLTYATTGIYLAWYFQFFLKRKYTSWWQKYAYLVFAGLSVGVAISGIIVTLVFGFGAGKNVNFYWWGNDVAKRGVDYQLYNNAAALKNVSSVGGHFGLAPDQYPLEW